MRCVSLIIMQGILAQTDDHLDTVLSSSSTTTKKPNVSSSTPMKTVKPPVIKALIPKSSSQPTPARSANSSRAGSIDKHPGPRSQSSRPLKYSAAERDRDRHGSSHSSDLGLMHSKKRPRSEGRSESPLPKKRATFAMEKEENLSKNISSAIWSMFGKKRDKYIGMDVFSDDEDMEADADDLEREEMFRWVWLTCERLKNRLTPFLLVHVSLRERMRKLLRRNADAKRRNVGAKRGGIGSLVNAYGGVPGLLEYFAFYCI